MPNTGMAGINSRLHAGEGGSGIAGTTGYARTHSLPHVKVLPVNHGRGAIKLYPLGLRMYATNSDK